MLAAPGQRRLLMAGALQSTPTFEQMAKSGLDGIMLEAAQGAWSYDAASKRYVVRLNGETTTYTLVARGEPVTCILYKGDLGSADLRASWFSFPTSEESPD